MLQKYIKRSSLILKDDASEEFVFELFKTEEKYNPDKKYIVIYDWDYFCWNVYELI